jgi:pimeloyl-ACP methyl ester carboxylesterase
MLLAATDVDRIAGAMLNDVGPDVGKVGIDRIGTYVGQDTVFSSWDDAVAGLRERNGELFPRWDDADWHRFARRVCYEADDGIRFEYDMAIADNFMAIRDAPPVDAWPLLRALEGRPVTILRGELSELLTQETADRMVTELGSDAELVIIPDAGHAPSLEEPEALAALDRLLERVSARAN